MPKDEVEAAMNQVNTTKAALNGTQNLEAKTTRKYSKLMV